MGHFTDSLSQFGSLSGDDPGLAGLATLASVALAGVLATAAIAKLRSPSDTSAGFARLQLPAPRLLGVAVPAIELVVATALIVRPDVGGLAALGMLTVFTGFLLRVIASGLDVSCGCLGSFDDGPVSWDSVVRNGALMIMSAVAASTTSLRPDAVGLDALLVAAGLALVTATAMQLATLRHQLGRLWSVDLAGEAGRLNTRRKQ